MLQFLCRRDEWLPSSHSEVSSYKSMQETEVPELNSFPKRFLCKGLRESCRSSGTQSGRHGSHLRQGRKRNGQRTAQNGRGPDSVHRTARAGSRPSYKAYWSFCPSCSFVPEIAPHVHSVRYADDCQVDPHDDVGHVDDHVTAHVYSQAVASWITQSLDT